MTLEEYLDAPAEKLKALTDAQIIEHFSAALNVTRPELAPKPQKNVSSAAVIDPKLKAKIALAEQLGLGDMSYLLNKKRKRK